MTENTQQQDLVRLGPWFGRVVDILTSCSTGEKFGRVHFAKHLPGVTEVHPLGALSPATIEQVREAQDAMEARFKASWEELLCLAD